MYIVIIKNQTNTQHQPHIMGNLKQNLMDKKALLVIHILKENLREKIQEFQILHPPGQGITQLKGKCLGKEAEVKVKEDKDLQNSHLADIK